MAVLVDNRWCPLQNATPVATMLLPWSPRTIPKEVDLDPGMTVSSC